MKDKDRIIEVLNSHLGFSPQLYNEETINLQQMQFMGIAEELFRIEPDEQITINLNDDEFNEPSFIKMAVDQTAEEYFQSVNGGKSSIQMVHDGEHIGATYCVMLMQQFASLQRINLPEPQTAVMPTDEEIKKKIFAICSEMRIYDGKTSPKTSSEMLIEFASWYKSQVKVVDLQSELIKFLIKREYPHAVNDESIMLLVTSIVDEYFKTKTKEV